MPTHTVRTTLTIPAEILQAIDRAIRAGNARSRCPAIARVDGHDPLAPPDGGYPGPGGGVVMEFYDVLDHVVALLQH